MRFAFPIRTLALAAALGSALAAPAFGQVIFDTFDGGGYGQTPEGAVQSALDDAFSTASAFGLFNCEVVGEPEIFASANPLRPFNAQVRIFCES